MNKLNKNQEQFCVEYTTVGQETFGNGTKAYRAAYPDARNDNSAAASASALLRNPKIQARILELHEENLTKNGVTVESVIANIQHDRTKAREAGLWSVACQLDKLEGQYLAMFSERLALDRGAEDQKPEPLTPGETALLQKQAEAFMDLHQKQRRSPGFNEDEAGAA